MLPFSEDTYIGGYINRLILVAISFFVAYTLAIAVNDVWFHPLSRFPGPSFAKVTRYWKAYVEVIQGRSFCHVLKELHAQYGDVVRVGPNELHFANPQAYHDIYNNKNRWDKEYHLYKSFGEDRSSFGFLTYAEAKERKDVLNKSFSTSAIDGAEGLCTEKVKALCSAFTQRYNEKKAADFFFAFRCMTMDIIVTFCFGTDIDAISAPEFKAPILEAMDASPPVFICFKYSDLYKNMIMNCPPNLTKILSPATMGLVNLQTLLKRQINGLCEDPEKLKQLPHSSTIYHRLLDPTLAKNGQVPEAGSLYEEAQALMFGGADTVGNTMMVGAFHLLHNPDILQRLQFELMSFWPDLNGKEPRSKDLESLPYLNAVIKESLRLSSGVVSGLLRITPPAGATICGYDVPGGTIVSCGSTFVHYDEKIFPEPEKFVPERWLENKDLDNWLVAFSKGPRMCLGINLAWCELRLGFAHVYRKFDMKFDGEPLKGLPWKDTFLPWYYGEHLKVLTVPVAA